MEHNNQKEKNPQAEQGEELLHCRNCDGYYDASLPNCPHCGEDTANNLNNTHRSSSVTQYEGGFGEAGSTLSRVAAGMIAALLVVGLLAGVVGAVRLISSRTGTGAEAAAVSAPAQEGAVSALPPAEEPQPQPEEPNQLPPEALRLDYSDLTLVNEGESYQFQVTVEPADWEGVLTWTTENQNVAVVSPEGKVKSVGRGESGIVISAGEVSYRCLVRCKSGAQAEEGGSASVQGYYINGKLMTMDEAEKVLEEERQKAAERQAAEEAQRQAEEEARKQAEEEAKKKAEEEAKKKAEEEARKQAEEEAKKKAEEEARKQAEEEAKKKAEEEEKKAKEEAKKAKEEAKKKKEAEQKAAEEKARQEAEQKAAEEEEKKKTNSNSITLQYYDITLVNVGDSYQFKPSGGDGANYSWSSANEGVASVSADGLVKATGVGQTTLTCKSGDSSVDVIVRVRSN